MNTFLAYLFSSNGIISRTRLLFDDGRRCAGVGSCTFEISFINDSVGTNLRSQDGTCIAYKTLKHSVVVSNKRRYWGAPTEACLAGDGATSLQILFMIGSK